ncbi:helix-turn-helix domain-containing protein [Actinophytocola oryzae]|nr:helix-turn-helix transcriptional regulator [Actinophytocola oryzae]
MSEKNPQPRDRQWGARLRAIRTERCNLFIGDAAARAGWYGSKLSRTERGLRPVSIQDVATLLTAWGLPAVEREQVLSELVDGSTSGWWSRPIPGVPEDVGTLASYEAEARELFDVAIGAVPGLVQTYAYAAGIMSASGVPPADIETRWMARLRRQQVLTKADYTAFISESALRTRWGGVEAWREQLDRLIHSDEIGRRIRIIPEDQTDFALLHSWLWMSFAHTPPVVHVELKTGATFVHEAEQYTELLGRLDHVGIPRSGTRTLIRRLIERA